MQKYYGKYCTEERCRREISARPRRAEMAQGQNEKCEADAVAEEADQAGSCQSERVSG
jgi:hypothetical protein